MIKFFKDICIFCKLKFTESNYKVGFFCESNFIFEYLEPYIFNKLKKNKVLIISFENIENNLINKASFFVFHTRFFRELVFLTLKLRVLYSSTPDLDYSIFKRSKFSRCKYIYLHHTPVSLTMIYNNNSFDAFNAVQCISTYQLKEMDEIIFKRNLNTRAFKSKYLFIKKQVEKNINQIPDTDLLIAPSWNSSFYKLGCHILLNKFLLESKISFKLRVHPMSLTKREISMNDLEQLNIPIDRLNMLNLFKYRFLITDWSGIFIEFAMIFKRKAFLINTPRKIVNQNYLKFDNKPIEISLRNILGQTFEVQNIQNIVGSIQSLKGKLLKKNLIAENEDVKKIINKNFFI